ncbi:MAG: hypothetical protein FIB07_11175 [Candidatus Methanoperedens sp.]|nr:hypothetical protein [Candidatus Methanoperedens sp.]
MKKKNLQYILKTLSRVFENSAQKAHIEEFKAKYRGVPWRDGIERTLLSYARSGVTMKRWIDNLINFMMEKNITYN